MKGENYLVVVKTRKFFTGFLFLPLQKQGNDGLLRERLPMRKQGRDRAGMMYCLCRL